VSQRHDPGGGLPRKNREPKPGQLTLGLKDPTERSEGEAPNG
jgi:hypothetical protein